MLLPDSYVASVTAAGAVPVLLPPVPQIEAALGRLDGLVLAGGGDIDPARWRTARARDPARGTIPARTGTAPSSTLAAAGAGQRAQPVLGICRGLQVILNVALGGDLHQHPPDLVGHEEYAPEPDDVGYGSHKVSVAPGSRSSPRS